MAEASGEAGLGRWAGFLKKNGIDKIMATAGDRMFRAFLLEQAESGVGEAVIRTVALYRGGVEKSQALSLIKKQAKLEGLSRQETLSRLSTAKTFVAAETAPATLKLRDAWRDVEGKDLRGGTISIVIALVEAFNIYHLLQTKGLNEHTKSQLVASGTVMAAATINMAIAPYDAALQQLATDSGQEYGALLKERYGLQGFKLVGGMLGSGVMLYTAYGSFLQAGNSRDDNYYLEMAAYHECPVNNQTNSIACWGGECRKC